MYHKCKQEQNESAQMICHKILEDCDVVLKLQATCCSRMTGYNLSRARKGEMGFLLCQDCQECWEKGTEERTKRKMKLELEKPNWGKQNLKNIEQYV